jgi:hypothetical protein
MVARVPKPFGSWILKMPLFSPVQLFFHFPLTMTGGKDARTLENPGKCQASNSLFFMVTFGSMKASHGHLLNDEVGWHLICFQPTFEKEDPLPFVQSDVFLFAF